ncbi:MAG: hypothetical protein R8K22_07425 [Mariprofundaceae bacterium]
MNLNGDLTTISKPLKVLFTSYLIIVGVGYIMGFTQILMTHGMADGKFGLSVKDVIYSYYGNRTGSLIETKLKGSMAVNASLQDRTKIIEWVRNGADEEAFKRTGIRDIVQNNCVMCHAADSSLPDFNVFANIKKRASYDEGASIKSLTRLSHIHLFGISFIFFFLGFIFCFAKSVSDTNKAFIIAIPFICQLLDIVSWWVTKWMPEFALVIILGGIGMAVSFTFMWYISMHDMWFTKPKLDEKPTET